MGINIRPYEGKYASIMTHSGTTLGRVAEQQDSASVTLSHDLTYRQFVISNMNCPTGENTETERDVRGIELKLVERTTQISKEGIQQMSVVDEDQIQHVIAQDWTTHARLLLGKWVHFSCNGRSNYGVSIEYEPHSATFAPVTYYDGNGLHEPVLIQDAIRFPLEGSNFWAIKSATWEDVSQFLKFQQEQAKIARAGFANNLAALSAAVRSHGDDERLQAFIETGRL